MQELIDEFMAQNKFAIVGASNNPEKNGNKIVHNLRNRGYEVYPVNPRLDEIDRIPCHHSLFTLPTTVDVVNIVVPPQVTERIVEECKRTRPHLDPAVSRD